MQYAGKVRFSLRYVFLAIFQRKKTNCLNESRVQILRAFKPEIRVRLREAYIYLNPSEDAAVQRKSGKTGCAESLYILMDVVTIHFFLQVECSAYFH